MSAVGGAGVGEAGRLLGFGEAARLLGFGDAGRLPGLGEAGRLSGFGDAALLLERGDAERLAAREYGVAASLGWPVAEVISGRFGFSRVGPRILSSSSSKMRTSPPAMHEVGRPASPYASSDGT